MNNHNLIENARHFHKRVVDEHELIQNSFHPIATKILLLCKLAQNIGERVQN